LHAKPLFPRKPSQIGPESYRSVRALVVGTLPLDDCANGFCLFGAAPGSLFVLYPDIINWIPYSRKHAAL